MEKVKVVFVDPNRLFREGMKRLLQDTQFCTVGEGKTLAEALAGIGPALDVIIWTVTPDENAEEHLALLHQVQVQVPEARIVVLSDFYDVKLLGSATQLAVSAFLSKDISGEILRRSLELVLLGQQVFPAPVMEALASSHSRGAPNGVISLQQVPPTVRSTVIALDQSAAGTRVEVVSRDQNGRIALSDRESQILHCLMHGCSNKAIARELKITEATVKVHVKGLLRKVRASNRTQAAIWAMNNAVRAGISNAEPSPKEHCAA